MNLIEFDIPRQILEVLSILSSNNINYWLFGGSVREVFTEKIPNDYDFVVTGIGREEFIDLLNKNQIESYLISSRNQVQGVDIGGIYCEFACCKKKRDLVEYVKSLDFTCNSILLDLESGNVVDVFHGCEDIAKKRIKTILPPNLYYESNPTAMLRAAYVAMRTGFHMDRDSIEAMRNCKKSSFDKEFRIISTRILNTILSNENCREGMKVLMNTGVLEKEFPKLNQRLKNNQVNFEEIAYINKTVQPTTNENKIDYKKILLFMDVFECEEENLDKLRFYDERNLRTGKLLKNSVHYYHLLNNMTLENIENLMKSKNIICKHRAEILNLIAELRFIKNRYQSQEANFAESEVEVLEI